MPRADAAAASLNGFDYDLFWHVAWSRANRTLAANADDTLDELRSNACPRIFVYDLPHPFSDWNPDGKDATSEAFGKPLRRVGGTQLCDTSGYAFGAMLHYRLWHSSAYRTKDPSQADLFFVPLLTKPKRLYALGQACAAVRREGVEALEASLPHLNARTAHRHFVVLSKEHVSSSEITSHDANCSLWFYRPRGLLQQALRVAYSEHQPASFRSSAYWPRLSAYPNSSEWEVHGSDFPNLHSMPFPGSIHAMQQEKANASCSTLAPPQVEVSLPKNEGPLQPWDTSKPRKYAVSFVGTTYHGDKPVRSRMQAQCKQMGASRCVFKGFGNGAGLGAKHESDFCLEAGGDTPFRKSLADSIGMGCVPMLFHPMTDHANGLLWSKWKEAARVLVPRDAFLAGRLTIRRLVDTCPPGLLALYKKTISTNARRFQISLIDDPGDAVHMMLTGLTEIAAVAESHHHAHILASCPVCGLRRKADNSLSFALS